MPFFCVYCLCQKILAGGGGFGGAGVHIGALVSPLSLGSNPHGRGVERGWGRMRRKEDLTLSGMVEEDCMGVGGFGARIAVLASYRKIDSI